MNENERDPQENEGHTEHGEGAEGGTSPSEPTHEATSPPGSGELDEEARERAEDDLEQAGGGH